jgi:hypothetical protein
MRTVGAAIALTIVLFCHTPSLAGNIYKWTDTDGVVVITNQPPPNGVRAVKVVPYPEVSMTAPASPAAERNQAFEAASQARSELDAALEDLEAAKIEAQNANAAADASREKVSARKRRKRAAQKRRARLAAEAAEAADAALREAEEKAAKAQEAAMAAERRVREPTPRPAEHAAPETDPVSGP